jgi:ribosomal protein S12 methylthiotransferase accessory factor
MSDTQPIVFLGPSFPVDEARTVLLADYRSPIKRGDLETIESGRVVALIDGVFDQDLAVSPREVKSAVERGVVVFGGASMGALRAAEVPGVVGVGKVYGWYRDGVINRDEEVALLFDPFSGQAQTLPAVNVRFALSRLCSLGTITSATANRLLTATLSMSFRERTPGNIVIAAGLGNRHDSADLAAMLVAHDLKRQDAQDLLEAVAHFLHDAQTQTPKTVWPCAGESSKTQDNNTSEHHPILIWESGDSVSISDLLDFMTVTGKLEPVLRTIEKGVDGDLSSSRTQDTQPQVLFTEAARRWGWQSSEEAHVTLKDLRLSLAKVDAECTRYSTSTLKARATARERTDDLESTLIARLFLDDLSLKREAMCLAGLRHFAHSAGRDPIEQEREEARQALCRTSGLFRFSDLLGVCKQMGLPQSRIDGFVDLVAMARVAARPLADSMCGRLQGPAKSPLLESCKKPLGEPRFALPLSEAETHARRVGTAIGITRIGMIAELANLTGVHVAQAARPGNAWSSSYGCGKSRTTKGAVIGSILEEVEKWAQEQFQADEGQTRGSFAELKDLIRCVDPATLDLPYDSCYHPTLCLSWYPCIDLVDGLPCWIPLDALVMKRRLNDIYYTRRGARKHLATNGLGCGFTLAEALLHALCEYVERHAQRLAEIFLSNPGGIGPVPYRFVDVAAASPRLGLLVQDLSNGDSHVRVLDITSDVTIPTFQASIIRDFKRADGYGAHPNPHVAIEMALLEAAQTIASATAGGREDLSIQARSLGRHERPRTLSRFDAWFWADLDARLEPLDERMGLVTDDIADEIAWCIDRVSMAGLPHVLFTNLTPTGIEPLQVVRICVPGLETNNPMFTGRRARLVLNRQLLPRWR